MKKLVLERNLIRANAKAVRDKAGDREIYADLSANAYGLGLVETAEILRSEGITHFIISDSREAAELRRHGFIEETIMMGRSTADARELSELFDLGVVCTVGSKEAAVALNGIAEAKRSVCEVMIKIDTGLGRYGFSPEETEQILTVYKYMPSLAIVGVFTTFSASAKSKRTTMAEYQIFLSVLDELTTLQIELGETFCIDSAALFRYSFGNETNAVCIGPAFAGRVPGVTFSSLKKVGYIAAGIEEISWFSKGHRVGGKVLHKAARLAVLSVGHYNGYGIIKGEEQRSVFGFLFAKNKRRTAKIGGRRVKVVGRIGLMHTIVDVTQLDCKVGDVVVLDINPIDAKSLPVQYIGE